MTTPNPTPKRPTFVLPKRYCANPACRALLPQGHKYATCSFACHRAVQAELERVEAADKLPAKEPF